MDRPLNILIVDDSAMMRAVVKRVVNVSGAPIGGIHEAGDGREGLAVLETQPIDIVFTDINMPVMNGVEMLREITARGWDHLVRIVVSTDGSATRREEVRALGVRACVEKPFSPEVIRDVIAALPDSGRAA
jgi:two-component system, chemotaxis family, chemotaxis protein CheY